MALSAKHPAKNAAGFTLLELLLTVVLLIALLGAVAFNFETLRGSADLEEGAAQFEALVRLAAAQAANTGRPVQIRFEDASTNEAPDTVALRVVQEVDPVMQPGMFVELMEARPLVVALVERVRLAGVRNDSWIDPALAGTDAAGATNAVANSYSGESTNAFEELDEVLFARPPVNFYPDGSSDEAEIILASIAPEDMRRVLIRLSGVTGELKRETYMVDADGFRISEPEMPELEGTNEVSAASETLEGTQTTPAGKMPDSSINQTNAIEDEWEF